MIPELSIIIPHKNISNLAIRCAESIPDIPEIEVFICDDCSDEKDRAILKEYVGKRNNITYLQSEEPLGGGHARNMGLRKAAGKWLIFSDADDFFSENMWSLFQELRKTDSDIIYFKVKGVDSDTLKPVKRGFNYNQYIDDVLQEKKHAEDRIRFFYMVPWGKMIRRELIEKHHVEFEEIRASNDVMFSTISAFYAKKIEVCDSVLYTITSRSGSLVKQKSKEILRCRFMAYVRQNKFLCSNGKRLFVIDLLKPMRNALMMFGLRELWLYLSYCLKMRVNPFTSLIKLIG